MRLYRLHEVSERLGGTPSYQSLKRWAALGMIDVSRTIGGGVYLMSDEQIKRLLDQMGRNDVDAEASAGLR